MEYKEIYFRNECAYPARIRIEYKDMCGNWNTHCGGWVIYPDDGAHLTVNGGKRLKTRSREIFFHAELEGNSRTWEGHRQTKCGDMMRLSYVDDDGDFVYVLDCNARRTRGLEEDGNVTTWYGFPNGGEDADTNLRGKHRPDKFPQEEIDYKRAHKDSDVVEDDED